LWQYFLVSNRIRSPIASIAQDAAESSLLEHATLVGLVVFNSGITLVGHALGIGSSYLYAIGSVSGLMALLLNDYVLRNKSKGLHLVTYIVGQVREALILGAP